MTFRPGKTQSLAPDRRRSGLVVGLRRADTGEVIQLETKPQRWLIGADPSCDMPIVGDPYISGCHCMIERRDNGSLLVRDRDSRNGTYVDGASIEAAELLIGSYLSVGRTTFVAVAGAGSGTRAPAIELLVGHDPVLRRTVDMALKAAQSDCSVLILGETGTGKDLLARVIHERSKRANGPYIAVNCGGIPRELIASELFGHEKGAFTGATESRDGYFLEANNGTLFLDELGELPLELQAHLLRALENRTVRRVGGSTERPINARIVAATNRLDGHGTDTARLRADLYHRIATLVLVLPPLRERMCDLAEIVNAQLAELAPLYGHKLILPEAWTALQRHSWPGNVRELRAAVGRAAMMGGDELLASDFFPDTPLPSPLPRAAPPATTAFDDDLQKIESVQRELMTKALERHGTIRAAAAALGMPKSTFADRARQWNLAPPGRRRAVGLSRRRYIGVTPPVPMAAPPPTPAPAPLAAPPQQPQPQPPSSSPPRSSPPSSSPPSSPSSSPPMVAPYPSVAHALAPMHLTDADHEADPHYASEPHYASAPMHLTESDLASDHASDYASDHAWNSSEWDAGAAEHGMPGRAREAAAAEWPAAKRPFEWPTVPESAYEAPRGRVPTYERLSSDERADRSLPPAPSSDERAAASPDETSMFELSSSDRVHELLELSQAPIATHVLDGEPATACAGVHDDAAFTGANETTTPDEHPPVHLAQRDSCEAL